MNKKNNSKLKNTFFGYNLYSSSFAPSPKERAVSQKKISPKINNKNIPLISTTSKRRNNSEDRNIIETIHEESFHSNDNNYSFSSSKNKNGKLSSIIFDEQTNSNSKNLTKISSLPYINDNMKVMVRIRPPLPREMEFGIPFRSICEVSSDNTVITILEYMGVSTDELERQHELIYNPSIFQHHRFTFDYVFDQDSTQLEVYLKAAKPVVSSILEGYNSTIFAYGQTGTGKTYTMEGFTFDPLDEKRGLVPRVIEEIFISIQNIEKNNINNNENENYILRASYLQIYNEYINDLLIPERKNLNIREDKKRGIYIDNLSEWVVRSSSDIYTLLEKGTENRATSSTGMNEISSRSHAIFIITVEQMTSVKENDNYSTKISKLNLVDLAGSERTKVTGAKGKQLEESKRINKSLSALGNVINALTELKGVIHIPYRDSKLTRLLEDSLGGNCKTTMITMISPCQDFISETLSSLSFAKRAKRIKNKPKINEEINHNALIKQYEIQLKNLRNELKKKNEILEKNTFMKEVEQLNEDKKNIINQLEQTSQMYYKERDEKKKLENKIEMLNKDYENYKNNNNVNNIQIEKTPEFISALEERQNTLLKEFDNKLQEFQKENNKNNNNNNNINNNEEIERYKQLILKQREMMSALTKKINERDETILQLQEENEVYEKINEQQDNNIFLLNQNFKNLIDYCHNNKTKDDDLNIENYLNIYKKINNDISSNKIENTNNNNQNSNNTGTNTNVNNNNKTNNKSNNSKKYLPYNKNNSNTSMNNNNVSFNSSSVSIFNNININSDTPVILLTADEKIKELKGIIKEKENEINILKLVSQKFLSSSCKSEEGTINLTEIKKSLQNGFELHTKIRELEEEKQNLKNENDTLNDKLLEYQNDIFKIQNILEDIKLNNLNNTNYIPSKNESLEKIVDNLNIGQAVDDINKIINKLITNNIDNLNSRNNIINNSYISEEILIKGNKNNSMDKDIIDDKDIIKSLSNIKDIKSTKNGFNPKIEQIINFNDKNNSNNEQFNINNTFSLNNNVGRRIKDDNLAKIANSLGNKKHKKEGNQKFLNKFINVDK